MIKLMKSRVKSKIMWTLAAASLTCGGLAQADEWPTDNIRLVVPYSAGGTTDLLTRKVADLLQKELTTVVVENRPGAGSTVATGQLARGGRGSDHMLLMASPGHTIGASIYPNLRYDPVEDFTFVRNVINIPNVMVVPVVSPYNTVAEFIEGAREKELSFSSSGIGSSIHMSGELFKSMTKTNMVHVPFRGSGEALPALLSGDVDVSFENMPTVYPHIKSGKLKALAVTTAEASEFLPGVPTIREAGKGYGLEDFETSAWFGLIAHKSFPEEGIDKLQAALDKVMASEEFKNFLPQFGAEAGRVSGDEFRQFIESELQKWSAVAEDANLKR
ncbi:Bug family tripartite tricarboxylate transporter substrate binding protein [Marinobacter sp. X15-166B]|uniref:Bug family tripartite tricarboxylate transporter substrate binding protein n=1 Tax=Marinobacter sp. X15-166B TaxID=1897620 RepID=UPI00085C3C1C|nr:tripartite tricarboxylate transporter substrate binding protein [Marinobacter sp. X15-166B]OEY66385.1 Bordetella uptake protein [Marinobacter sp. X15-166B]